MGNTPVGPLDFLAIAVCAGLPLLINEGVKAARVSGQDKRLLASKEEPS